MLNNALRVGAGRIYHLDAASRRGIDVDLIVTDPVTAHDPELSTSIEEGRVDNATGANDETFGAHHLALKGRRIEPAGHP